MPPSQEHRESGWQRADLAQTSECVPQEVAIRTVGPGRHQVQRNPHRIGQFRAFAALLAAIDR